MKISGKKGIANILKILVTLSMILGIIFLLLLYNITKWLNIHFDLFIMMIYPCGIVFLYLAKQFLEMFNSLKENNQFSMDNVKRLKKAMISSFVISMEILISLFINVFKYDYYSLQLQVSLGFLIILFFGVGVALYILKELFKEATKYKEENDLTI